MLPLVALEDDAGVRSLGHVEHCAHLPDAEQPGLIHPDDAVLRRLLELLVDEEPGDGVGFGEAFLRSTPRLASAEGASTTTGRSIPAMVAFMVCVLPVPAARESG